MVSAQLLLKLLNLIRVTLQITYTIMLKQLEI